MGDYSVLLIFFVIGLVLNSLPLKEIGLKTESQILSGVLDVFLEV